DAALLAKILADALFLGEGISHRSCSCAATRARPKIKYGRSIFIKSAGVALHGGAPAFFYLRKAKSIT
ncbi:MAG: hypothetical protein ABI821_14680, partial [Pseudomonadota bacterium]